jgi:hypothetical protein
MKKIILSAICCSILFFGYSQKNKKDFGKGQCTIYYSHYENGNSDNEANPTALTIEGSRSSIRELFGEKKMIPQVPVEEGFVFSDSAKWFQTAQLSSGEKIMYITPLDKLPKLEKTTRKDTIMGYICEVFTTTLRSNRIDISVYHSEGIKATPAPSLGVPDGIALRIVMNGNTEIRATKITENIASKKIIFPTNFKTLPNTAYRAAITAGYITTIPIFQNQQICFGCADTTIQNDNKLTQIIKVANGTVVLKKVCMPKFEPGALFAELTEFSNGDAYDRTGSVFIIPDNFPLTFLTGCLEGVEKLPIFTGRNGKKYQGMVATENYEPIVELLRFYTPFGVHHFNPQVAVEGLTWNDSAFYKQDITPLMPYLKEGVWIGAFIGNYDKGGHRINLSLKYYPDSKEIVSTPSTKGKPWIKPLFCTTNVLEMAGQEYGTLFDQDSLTINFTIPEGITNLKLRYITTGHGGWGEGDEFNPKENEIFIDGRKVYGFIPWRTDCGTYRLLNPASGNFWNGTSSSDYSRSGWCPGTATNPTEVPIPALSAGPHTMKIAIKQGAPEGGSFSAWNISGVLIGEQK